MNSRRKIILVFILAIGLGLTIGIMAKQRTSVSVHKDIYYCPMHPNYTSDRPGNCPICNMNLVKRESNGLTKGQKAIKREDLCLLHNCPMVHDGKPCPMLVVGKEGEDIICPICQKHLTEQKSAKKEKKILYWTDPMIPGYKASGPGKSPMGMDLVPVYEEEAPAAAAPSPDGYASVMLSPQKQQLIGIRTTVVKREKLIKTIRAAGTVAHDPELYQAEAEYIQAIAAYERSKVSAIPEITKQARRLVDSARIRLEHLGLSQELIDDTAKLRDPDHSLLVAHEGPVWVYARIFEYELPFIHVGQKVSVDVPAVPGNIFEGTVRAIDPMVDAATRTVRVRAQVDNPHGELKPDMYVNAAISVDLGNVIVVPQEAVFNTGLKQVLFVDKGQGIFEPRDVVVGARTKEFYQILKGVKEEERVVISGNFLIDSESHLQAVFQDMSGEGQTGGQAHGQ